MKLYDAWGWWAHDYAYMFFKYDEMVKLRLRAYNSRRMVRVSDLSEDLTAANLMQRNPPIHMQFMEHNQFQHWKSFSLDLVSFSKQRGLPDLLVTLIFGHMSSLLWIESGVLRSIPGIERIDRQLVGPLKWLWWLQRDLNGSWKSSLNVMVMFIWNCWWLCVKKWNIRSTVLFTGTCFYGLNQGLFLMAELPRSLDPNDRISAYLRKLFTNAVYLNVYGGKRLHTCKYGFPLLSLTVKVLEMFAGINVISQNFSDFLNNALFKNAIVSASLK